LTSVSAPPMSERLDIPQVACRWEVKDRSQLFLDPASYDTVAGLPGSHRFRQTAKVSMPSAFNGLVAEMLFKWAVVPFWFPGFPFFLPFFSSACVSNHSPRPFFLENWVAAACRPPAGPCFKEPGCLPTDGVGAPLVGLLTRFDSIMVCRDFSPDRSRKLCQWNHHLTHPLERGMCSPLPTTLADLCLPAPPGRGFFFRAPSGPYCRMAVKDFPPIFFAPPPPYSFLPSPFWLFFLPRLGVFLTDLFFSHAFPFPGPPVSVIVCVGFARTFECFVGIFTALFLKFSFYPKSFFPFPVVFF